MSYHPTLQRQIEKYFGKDFQITPELSRFFEAVGKTYYGYDEDKDLFERSLDLSSKEQQELVDKLKESLRNLESKTKDLENINTFLVGRENKMAELKKKIGVLENALKKFEATSR